MLEIFQFLFPSTMMVLGVLFAVVALFVPNAAYTINGTKYPMGVLGRILWAAWAIFCAYVWWTLIP